MSNPLISIIIPTFNRAHLIGETLDSIIAQTYNHWECLIIDDGSTDNTEDVIRKYVAKDARFHCHKRPESKLKGANACRNIGLDKSIGEFIVFFDSDDLMTPDHLQIKVEGILEHQCDYVITKTKFFNKEDDRFEHYYRFHIYEITPYNYVLQKINWLTYDILLESRIAKSIRFNEKLKSGQEYNYFSKLVHISQNARFINKVTTLRRHHEQSIRSSIAKQGSINKSAISVRWITYLEIKHQADDATRGALLIRIVQIFLKENQLYGLPLWKLQYYLYREFGSNSIYFSLYFLMYKLTKKGNFLRKKVVQFSKYKEKGLYHQ